MVVPFRKSLSLFALIIGSFSVVADIPEGYYDSVDTSNGEALRNSLHDIIDDHTRFPYSTSGTSVTDTWDILAEADEDLDDPLNVVDLYRNRSFAKQYSGNSFYNREHVWPKSFGFPDNGGDGNYPYTDVHHLFTSDDDYNGARSNKPFDNCSSGCTEWETDLTNGRGGTTMDSNFTEGDFTYGKWETWRGRKGDVARAIFYMAVRYEGGTHGDTGFSEPDLRLTDDRDLIESARTNQNEDIAYMGLKTVLLQWHEDDPVDAIEQQRNDVIYSYQGNRNPFIDHPEYVKCVFELDCSELGGSVGDETAPQAPQGVTSVATELSIRIEWNNNLEADLAGYWVYRSIDGGNFERLNTELLTETELTDTDVTLGVEYSYYVTAQDDADNESEASATVSDTLVDLSPEVVTGLSASYSNGRVSLSWNANSETDLAGYEVYRSKNGGDITTLTPEAITDTSIQDSDVAEGDTLEYYVLAVDTAGNISSQSEVVSVSIPVTPTEPDNNDNSSSGGGAFWFTTLLLLAMSRRKNR